MSLIELIDHSSVASSRRYGSDGSLVGGKTSESVHNMYLNQKTTSRYALYSGKLCSRKSISPTRPTKSWAASILAVALWPWPNLHEPNPGGARRRVVGDVAGRTGESRGEAGSRREAAAASICD
eukprot:scaffold126661_cov28-Tisochrysis_lutea.AAC.15